FLHRLGFDCIGLDISREMIGNAQSIDPEGTYLLVKDGDLGDVGERAFDLVFSAFTFDNIANSDHKLRLLKALRRKLRSTGIMINLVS
ncbi:MAG: methyltransferase domain-containing protein, partial [Phycisphaerae bacterium]|nr:methyltransferase domain-containing protein [Phycisphaerae bacterium]